MLEQYLSKEAIRCNVEADSWQESIRQAAIPLVEAGKIKQSYVERAIAKVEELGPYIVLAKGVAVAHARPKEDVQEESISLITLKEPVRFGHKTNDPVSIVFLLAATNDNGHIGAIMEVAQLLCQEGMQDRIVASCNEEEIYGLLTQVKKS